MSARRGWARLAILLLPLLLAAPAFAGGYTETLPQSAFLFDFSYLRSSIDSMWDNSGKQVPLMEPIDRYEPGAGKQGTLKAEPKATFNILAMQLYYGVLDHWTVGFGIPVVLYTEIDPQLSWEEGDYQWNLGRAYSEQDFWEWADSMGQPKPEKWRGNEGTLGDIQFGTVWRFTDYYNWFKKYDMAMAFKLTVALPTGSNQDPEEVIGAGTTSWALHANGDLGIHLSYDKFFKDSLDGRLTLGVDVFHEFLFPKTYTSSTGEKNPLLLNNRRFVGQTYTVDGGDFTGVGFLVSVVPFKGPALATWLAQGDASRAETFPPMLSLTLRYTHIHLQQTDWESNSDMWDYDQENLWRPGYKNMLNGDLTLALLRVGVPMMPYVNYRNLSWIPGKNARAADVIGVGTKVIMQFW